MPRKPKKPRKPQWLRSLYREEEDTPNRDQWYPRKLGCYNISHYQPYDAISPHPIYNGREGQNVRRASILKAVRRAIIRSTHRREWEQAALLLLGYLKKTFQSSRSFTQFSYTDTIESRFPAAEYLTRVLVHLDNGQPLLHSFLDRLQTDRVSSFVLIGARQFVALFQDYRKPSGRCIFYALHKLMLLLVDRKHNKASSIVEALKQDRYNRIGIDQPNGLTLQVLIRFSCWSDAVEKEALERGVVLRFTSSAFEQVSDNISTYSRELKSCFTKKADLSWMGISMNYIYARVSFWLGSKDELMRIADDVVTRFPDHSDAHALRSALLLTNGSDFTSSSLLELLRMNPNDHGAFALLSKLAKEYDAASKITETYINGLLQHLDICHPDRTSLKQCIKRWSELRRLLQRALSTKGDVATEPWVTTLQRELKPRLHWWQTYFFSPFSLRCFLHLPQGPELQKLLQVLAHVSCFLYGMDNSFLQQAQQHLSPSELQKIQQTSNNASFFDI